MDTLPIPSQAEFLSALQKAKHELSLPLLDSQLQSIAHFAHLLHQENRNQNLTRILGIQEFIAGHLQDVMELFHVEQLGSVVLDIGSGGGVPGLLAAIIDSSPRRWVLVESENNKADFLKRAVESLDLKNVTVHSARVEQVIHDIKPDTVIARAVGTVDRIARWILPCSTWNTFVLFKSRSWEEEWKEAQRNAFGKKLTISQVRDYSEKDRCRKLIILKRK